MTMLTITRKQVDDTTNPQSARLLIEYGTKIDPATGKPVPRTAGGRFFRDGSGRIDDGPRGLLDWAGQDLGKRRVRSALIDAFADGVAVVS